MNTFDPLDAVVNRWGVTDGEAARRYRTSDVSAADREWLLGVLNARPDLIRLDDDAVAMLDVFTRRAFTESVTLESRAVATVQRLRERGIETRLLKGAAVAHLDYDDPSYRLFGDIDLLVRGHDIRAAIASLEDAGFRRRYEEPYAGYDEFVGKGVAMEGPSGTVIDLHRTLALGYFGTRLATDDLWAESDDFDLAGTQLAALSKVNRLLHCAIHLALAPNPKLVNALDMCVITGGADHVVVAEAVERAERWRCAVLLARAVDATTRSFGDEWAPDGLRQWASSAATSPWNRTVLSAFHGPLASSRLRTASAIVGLKSWTERRLALRGLVGRGRHRE